MRYWFSTEARADVREARAFLRESRQKQDEFASAVGHAIQALIEHPLCGSPYELNTRRILLEGFPYAMVYYVGIDGIHIVAVTHHRRDPAHWHDRLAATETE